jgi:uncharacterized protein (TIGR00251 family)
LGIKKGIPGVRLAVKVTPNAGRNEINGYKDGVLQIKVSAAPEKGKANKALVDLLSERLGIRKTSIAIIKGETSRNKVILIDRISSEDLVKLLKIEG